MGIDGLTTILTRRSIRKYAPQSVPQDAVHQLLEAAMAAPSASNAQPWHFVVVSDRRQLDALAAVLTNGQMLRQAPLAIVVCGEPARSDYWVQDCSAATENILLAAHALGLGGVWLGVYPRADRVTAVSEVADLPAHIIPLCVLSLGFPAEEKAPADRYNEARVHRERW